MNDYDINRDRSLELIKHSVNPNKFTSSWVDIFDVEVIKSGKFLMHNGDRIRSTFNASFADTQAFSNAFGYDQRDMLNRFLDQMTNDMNIKLSKEICNIYLKESNNSNRTLLSKKDDISVIGNMFLFGNYNKIVCHYNSYMPILDHCYKNNQFSSSVNQISSEEVKFRDSSIIIDRIGVIPENTYIFVKNPIRFSINDFDIYSVVDSYNYNERTSYTYQINYYTDASPNNIVRYDLVSPGDKDWREYLRGKNLDSLV